METEQELKRSLEHDEARKASAAATPVAVVNFRCKGCGTTNPAGSKRCSICNDPFPEISVTQAAVPATDADLLCECYCPKSQHGPLLSRMFGQCLNSMPPNGRCRCTGFKLRVGEPAAPPALPSAADDLVLKTWSNGQRAGLRLALAIIRKGRAAEKWPERFDVELALKRVLAGKPVQPVSGPPAEKRKTKKRGAAGKAARRSAKRNPHGFDGF